MVSPNPFTHLFAPRSFAEFAEEPPHRVAAAAGPGHASLKRPDSSDSSRPNLKKKRVSWSHQQANDGDKATSRAIRSPTPPPPASDGKEEEEDDSKMIDQDSLNAVPAQAGSSKTLMSPTRPSTSAPAAAARPTSTQLPRPSALKPIASGSSSKPQALKKPAWDPLASTSATAAKPAAWDPLAPPPRSAPVAPHNAKPGLATSHAGPSNSNGHKTDVLKKPMLAPLKRIRQHSGSSAAPPQSRPPVSPTREADYSPPSASSATFPQTSFTSASSFVVSTSPLDAGRRSSNGAPIITPSDQLSNKVPILERNKSLENLYKAFRAAYGLETDRLSVVIVLPEPPSNASSSSRNVYNGPAEAPAIVEAVLASLASAHARKTEVEAFRLASKESYKMATRSPLVSLTKRKNDKEALERIFKARQMAVNDVAEHLIAAAAQPNECTTQAALESIAHALFRSDALGTSAELARRRDERTRRENSRLTLQRLQEAYFLAPPDKLATWGFSIPPLLSPHSNDDVANEASPKLAQGTDASASSLLTACTGLQAALEQAWGRGDSELNHGIDIRRKCERCKTEFTVRDVRAQHGTAKAAVVLAEAEAEARLRPADPVDVDDEEEGELVMGEADKVVIANAKKALASAERVLEECSFHWGRARVEKDNGTVGAGRGTRVVRYTCCGAADASSAFGSLAASAAAAGFAGASVNDDGAGCTRGPHVWKAEDVQVLHSFAPFVSVAAIRARVSASASRTTSTLGVGQSNADELKRWTETKEVVALDAELVYTTAGMSIARVTLVDEDGSLLADHLVRPEAPVLDYNTRFSGIREGDIVDAMTLTQVQDSIVRWIGPETALVGHGLENDLRALRLVHTCIVDSALLFPHPHGLPKRKGLKELAMNHLHLSIQTGGADGHNSAEDARVALNLIKWKYASEPETSPFRPIRRATLPGPRPIVQRPHSNPNSNSGSPPPALASPLLGSEGGSSSREAPLHSPMQSYPAGSHRSSIDAAKAAANAAAKTAAARQAAAEAAAAKIAQADELAAEQAAAAEAEMQAKAEAAIKAKAAAKAAARAQKNKTATLAAKKEAAVKAAAEKAAKKKEASESKAAKLASGWSASPEPAGSPQASPTPSSLTSPEPEHVEESVKRPTRAAARNSVKEPIMQPVKAEVPKRLRLIPEVVIDVRPPRRER